MKGRRQAPLRNAGKTFTVPDKCSNYYQPTRQSGLGFVLSTADDVTVAIDVDLDMDADVHVEIEPEIDMYIYIDIFLVLFLTAIPGHKCYYPYFAQRG